MKIANADEQFEMIEKLIIIEKRLEAMKDTKDRVGGQYYETTFAK